MWYAGIDWADAHHDVAGVDESGRLGSWGGCALPTRPRASTS
jgi:hypothetical protein